MKNREKRIIGVDRRAAVAIGYHLGSDSNKLICGANRRGQELKLVSSILGKSKAR